METSQAQPSAEPVVDTPLSPRVVLFWRASWVIGTAVLLVPALLVAVAATAIPAPVRLPLPLLVLILGIAGTIWVPAATYERWRFAITDEGVELRHGLVIHRESSIPNFRVQHIDVEQGPLERWRGIVTLTISTASPASDAVIPGITPEQAEELRSRILSRAEAGDGV